MDFRILGTVEIRDDDRPLAIGAPRTRAVLGVLLTQPGSVVSIDRLVDELWPDRPPPDARALVHGYLSRLRRTLRGGGALDATDRLVTRKPGYLLRVDDGELDLHRFERLVAEARAARQAGDPERCLDLYTRAHQQWRGAPFADVPHTPTIAAAVTALTELRLTALEERFEVALGAGRGSDLVVELTELVTQNPLRERLVGQLMLALSRAGRTGDALGAYRTAKRRLADELGVDPGAELQRLELAVLQGEPEQTAGGTDRYARVRPAQLPGDLSTFTGRTGELARLLALGAGRHHRPAVVVSAIDGMAGIGKTALAVHAARRLAGDFPDGQLFIDLHGFTENIAPVQPADALDRMLRALGVPGEQIPAGPEERAALLRSRLADRRMLILLDNAVSESQVRPLLPGAPGCLVIITSRFRLCGLENAVPLSLDLLPMPDATTLFVQAAGEAGAGGLAPERVAEVVELCGRLPLAIGIAAARFRARPAWTLQHLIDRLRDQRGRLAELEAGQRSVGAAFQLSYQYLTGEQRQLFRLLGLHPGADFDSYAAAALAGIDPVRAGQLLEVLVDAHLLLAPEPGRYRFHDLLRAHAASTAAQDEPEHERRIALTRLLDHYLGAAAAAVNACYPTDAAGRPDVSHTSTVDPAVDQPGTAATWLDAELPNLFAAAGHAAEHGWPAHTGTLSRILHRHLDVRCRLTEAETLHSRALRAARQTGDRRTEAYVLNHLSGVRWKSGRYRLALEHLEQALDLHRQTSDEMGQASALSNLGIVHAQLGDYQRALDHLHQSLKLRRRLGYPAMVARTLGNIGHTYLLMGRYPQALEHLEEAFELCCQTGSTAGRANVQHSLGAVYLRLGRPARAIAYLRQAVALNQQAGNPAGLAESLNDLGKVHCHLGDHATAIDHHRRALALHRELGDPAGEAADLNGLGGTLRAAGRMHEALTHYEDALAVAHRTSNRLGQAGAHRGLAETHAELDDRGRARSHWKQALDLYTELGLADAEAIRAELDRLDA